MPDLEELLKTVEKLEFKIPVYSERILILKACQHHNAWQKAKAANLDDLLTEPKYINEKSHKSQLDVACVNFFKSRFEKKYPEWGSLLGSADYFDAYALGKNKLLKAVQAAYPHLELACLRQMV